MDNTSNDISQLSIRQLLGGDAHYTIPMYQRNYAWGEGEITQLIQDIIDYLPEKDAEGRNYYIGTLVVFEKKNAEHSTYEVIDGQQRLTTLALLASFFKNKEIEDKKCDSWYKKQVLSFECREHSQYTFNEIFNGKDTFENYFDTEKINTAILNGYRLIKKILPQKLNENGTKPQQFSDFLFENVQIMRVKVPKDTDLNHYFEIMNNRGEQLEKHEILKSRMMEALKNDKSQHCFHLIWEACANMERYVQMGFSPKHRDAIFGNDWNNFSVENFEKLQNKITPSTDEQPDKGSEQDLNDSEQKLDDIIKQANGNVKISKDEETPERFNSVINFPNFLLHVLRVQTAQDILG